MLLLTALGKLVGNEKQRIQTKHNEMLGFGGKKMAQARVLNEKELKLLLLYVNTRKYAARDRAMVCMSYYAGMRVGEIAATKVADVLALDGSIKEELRLTAAQTKGKRGRVVVLSEKLRKELHAYLLQRFGASSAKDLIAVSYSDAMNTALFVTQKKRETGFTANGACWHMHMLYKQAGLDGCSSHSGRRSFLTALSARAVPLKVLMELAGHRQAQTTMRYVDVTTDMKRAAVELL
jgi:integrase/recombinase XerD